MNYLFIRVYAVIQLFMVGKGLPELYSQRKAPGDNRGLS
jgi:hypothetical protein